MRPKHEYQVSNFEFRISIFLVLFSILIISFDATAAGSEAGEADPKDEVAGLLERKTISRFYDPVEFRGEMLEGFLGKKLSHLRLYSLGEGSFRQVPFIILS